MWLFLEAPMHGCSGTASRSMPVKGIAVRCSAHSAYHPGARKNPPLDHLALGTYLAGEARSMCMIYWATHAIRGILRQLGCLAFCRQAIWQ